MIKILKTMLAGTELKHLSWNKLYPYWDFLNSCIIKYILKWYWTKQYSTALQFRGGGKGSE